MSLSPEAGTLLTIDGLGYRFTEDPAAAGLPFRQIGRCSTVYRLQRQDGALYALKVPVPNYRLPVDQAAEHQSEAVALTAFANLPGLQSCQRTVLTPGTHAELLWYYPELTDATLMPWIDGLSWQEVILGGYAISLEDGHSLGKALILTLALAESHGLAHCDLSGSNVLLPDFGQVPSGHLVELVDLDGMYALGLALQEAIPGRRCLASGSPGYAHRSIPRGTWGPLADRFAAAVLLAEMLAWSDPQVRLNAYGKQYFDPDELQANSDRYHLLVSVLRRRSGDAVVEMFRQAWFSSSLSDCPPLVEWAHLLKVPLVYHLGDRSPVAIIPAMPLAVGPSSLWPASPQTARPVGWLPVAEHTTSRSALPARETPHPAELAVPAGPLLAGSVFYL